MHVNLNSRIFFSVTCRSEIVIAYGALYDHSSKRPKITQFFAGKAPPADGKAAPPPMAGGADGKAGAPNPPASKAVPAVPPPVAAPTPKAGSTDDATAVPKAVAAPKAAAAPKAIAATTAVPKAVAATATPKASSNLPGMQFVAEVSDPPVKLMLGGDGILALQSMSQENRKLKKMSILLSNVSGKLVRSAGGAVPPNSIRYSVQLNSPCVDHLTSEASTVKDLCKKFGINEIHGYQPFPTGIPQKLVETSDLWILHHQTICCFLVLNPAKSVLVTFIYLL